MHIAALIVVGLLLVLDCQNLLGWWRGWTLRPSIESTDDYTIIIPLFGDPAYFTGRAALEPLSERVLVVCEVTPPAMAAYADELEGAGFSVVRVVDAHPNSARLVATGVEAVRTTYALRLDADTLLQDGLARAVKAVADAGVDLASVRVEVNRPHTLAGRLQRHEYRMAMLARRYRPWMTSGACFIGRTDALRAIFERHSLWTPGEDIETGRVALAMKMRVRHLDYTVWTDAPETFPSLYRQRRLWWAGNYRHMVINFDHNILQLPVLSLYYILGAWVGLTMHVWSYLSPDAVLQRLPAMFLLYLIITVVTNLQALSPWMVVFPVYSLVQSLIMPLLGLLTYARLAYRRRDLGRYRCGWVRRRRVPAPATS